MSGEDGGNGVEGGGAQRTSNTAQLRSPTGGRMAGRPDKVITEKVAVGCSAGPSGLSDAHGART